MTPPDFRRAFRDGEVFQPADGGERRVEVRAVGAVSLPTGRVVATDPFVFPERKPFRQAVPPGRYPILLSIAHIKPETGRAKPDQRVACAMLRLTRRAPVRWRMATMTGQRLRDLKPGHFFGYPVDAGLGCFLDARAAKLLDRLMRDDPDYFERMMTAAEPNYAPTRDWADFPLDDTKGGLNVVFFSSGFGDGSYPSFWGFDADGGVACLVTDFQVVTSLGVFVDDPAPPDAPDD